MKRTTILLLMVVTIISSGMAGYGGAMYANRQYAIDTAAEGLLYNPPIRSIETENSSIEALLLSPLAVLPQYRNKGVGASLVREAMSRAKSAGYIAVFLCGDPKYYGCFGFIPVDNYNISYDMDVPRQMCWGANWLRGG